MKIRTGFVSNSSSSSFLIYGAICDVRDLAEIAKKLGVSESFTQEGVENHYYFEWLEDKLDLSIYRPNDNDTCYIGLSWCEVGDKETGEEFEARVEKTIKDAGLECKLGTYSKAWYN